MNKLSLAVSHKILVVFLLADQEQKFLDGLWQLLNAMRLSEQEEKRHQLYQRDECNQMATPRLRISTCILGEVTEEKIDGPCRHMPKLSKSS